MYGFILNYARANNYYVNIYCNNIDNLNWINFYKNIFTNFEIKYCSEYKKDNDYLYIFLTTDDDWGFNSDWINRKVVIFNHSNNIKIDNKIYNINENKFI